MLPLFGHSVSPSVSVSASVDASESPSDSVSNINGSTAVSSSHNNNDSTNIIDSINNSDSHDTDENDALETVDGRYRNLRVEVTADDLGSGVDLQGINWSRLGLSRKRFRDSRVQSYPNYSNNVSDIPENSENISITTGTSLPRPRTDAEFYNFRTTRLKERCSIVHFQLRNLVWATSLSDVFYCSNSQVRHWSPLSRTSRTAIDLDAHSIGAIRIASMAAKHGVLTVGGFNGELVCTSLHSSSPNSTLTATQTPIHIATLTAEPNAITNHVDLEYSRTGSLNAWISSNDDCARIFDIEMHKVIGRFPFDHAINCSTLSPDSRLMCVVGDAKDTQIVDADHGAPVHTLTGHTDYSFSCAFSPCGRFIATGNQDRTTRLYDLRNTSETLTVLHARMGAIRSLRFNPQGLLAAAEPADFVHIYDLSSPESRSQVIDFFGEIAGISFAGDSGELLWIGNADEVYGCLMEFEREDPDQNGWLVDPYI